MIDHDSSFLAVASLIACVMRCGYTIVSRMTLVVSMLMMHFSRAQARPWADRSMPLFGR